MDSLEDIVETQKVEIACTDGRAICATLFSTPSTGRTGDGPVVLLSCAAAVPQTYYANFSRYLLQCGAAAVMTYDYRGVAQSAGSRSEWKSIRMKDWAVLDFPAAASELKSRFPDRSMLGLGHSYGGQALGLSGASNLFERYATVATMSGYWRHLDTPLSVWFQTQIVGQSVARVLGHVPGRLGIGETLPGSVFLDWARWIKNPDYFFTDPDLPEVTRFPEVELPYLSIGLTDDPWGTKQAVRSFMKHYTGADLREVWLSPASSGPVGHLGFFRRAHRDTHWPVVRDFLFEGIWGSAEPLQV